MRPRRHNDIASFRIIGQAMLPQIFQQFFIIKIGKIVERTHIIFGKRQHHTKADIFKGAQIISDF